LKKGSLSVLFFYPPPFKKKLGEEMKGVVKRDNETHGEKKLPVSASGGRRVCLTSNIIIIIFF